MAWLKRTHFSSTRRTNLIFQGQTCKPDEANHIRHPAIQLFDVSIPATICRVALHSLRYLYNVHLTKSLRVFCSSFGHHRLLFGYSRSMHTTIARQSACLYCLCRVLFIYSVPRGSCVRLVVYFVFDFSRPFHVNYMRFKFANQRCSFH